MTILETMSDSDGSAALGWIGGHVLYARFEKTISAELGVRFAHRFTSLVGDRVAVHYFSDSSRVLGYELAALATISDALLAKRDQFKLVVVRPWDGRLGAKAQSLLDSIGCLEYVTSGSEFDARLRAAAPRADVEPLTTPVDSGTDVNLDPSGSTPPPEDNSKAAPATKPQLASAARTYVFDLTDFEQGRFTATRFTHLAARPRGAWVCVARSDEQALTLAHQAALAEWAAPRTRPPEQFTVQFIDAKAEHRSGRRQ